MQVCELALDEVRGLQRDRPHLNAFDGNIYG